MGSEIAFLLTTAFPPHGFPVCSLEVKSPGEGKPKSCQIQGCSSQEPQQREPPPGPSVVLRTFYSKLVMGQGPCSAWETKPGDDDQGLQGAHSLGVGITHAQRVAIKTIQGTLRVAQGCGCSPEEIADFGPAVFMEEVRFELAFER